MTFGGRAWLTSLFSEKSGNGFFVPNWDFALDRLPKSPIPSTISRPARFTKPLHYKVP